jgi:peptide subunit release factor 1 (eRF1)
MHETVACPGTLRASRARATVIHEENAMLGGSSDEKVELECPECGAKVKTTAKEAEKGKVKCPRGHEFAVMGMLGGLGGAQ